jgi:hypothetical protein
LTSVTEESIIQFIVPEGGKHPLMVTDKYMTEREKKSIPVTCVGLLSSLIPLQTLFDRFSTIFLTMRRLLLSPLNVAPARTDIRTTFQVRPMKEEVKNEYSDRG